MPSNSATTRKGCPLKPKLFRVGDRVQITTLGRIYGTVRAVWSHSDMVTVEQDGKDGLQIGYWPNEITLIRRPGDDSHSTDRE
jgi:hypothetical protein